MQEVEQRRSSCREARMAPGFHALGKIGAEHTFGGEEFQHLVAQRFTECCLGQRRQHSERAGGEKDAVGNQGMDMRVEGY